MKLLKLVDKLFLVVLLLLLEVSYLQGTKYEKKNRIIIIHTGQQHGGWGGWGWGGGHKVIHHHHGWGGWGWSGGGSGGGGWGWGHH